MAQAADDLSQHERHPTPQEGLRTNTPGGKLQTTPSPPIHNHLQKLHTQRADLAGTRAPLKQILLHVDGLCIAVPL